MPEGKLTAILKHIVFYGVKLWAVNQQNAEDVQLRRQRLQLPVDWNTTIKLKVVKLGAFTKSRGFLEMIKKYWFLLSTAQERTNANAKLGDAHFALPLEIYSSMTHHLFWALIHYKIVSSKLISCFSVDNVAPLTPPPSEGLSLFGTAYHSNSYDGNSQTRHHYPTHTSLDSIIVMNKD